MIDDNMGMADNAVRLLKSQYRKYANRIAHERPGVIWGPEKDALIWQNYEMDVDLAIAFIYILGGQAKERLCLLLPQAPLSPCVGFEKMKA